MERKANLVEEMDVETLHQLKVSNSKKQTR